MRFTVFSLLLFASLAAAQLPVTNGGTGAATASGARSNLGAAASTDVVPSGAIMFIKTGTCPTGWTQESGFIGLYILATTAAAGDVGTTGGSTSYTPAGSSAAPTVASLTAAAQTFTGSSVTSGATSAGTPAGSNTLGGFAQGAISWPATPPTIAAGTFTQPTIAWPTAPTNVPTNAASATSGNCATTNIAAGTGSLNACKATAPNLTVTAQTISWPTKVPVASSGAFAEGAISWPVNVPAIASGTFTQPTFTGSLMGTHTHSVTAAGTNSASNVTGTLAPGAFSGTPATIQAPFIKLIPCSKN